MTIRTELSKFDAGDLYDQFHKQYEELFEYVDKVEPLLVGRILYRIRNAPLEDQNVDENVSSLNFVSTLSAIMMHMLWSISFFRACEAPNTMGEAIEGIIRQLHLARDGFVQEEAKEGKQR